MRIALIMPPMDSGAASHSAFRWLHELAKGKPHWTRSARRIARSWRGAIDFEDFPKGLITLATMIDRRHEVRIFSFINAHHTLEDVEGFRPHVVGISCSTGSSLIWVHHAAERLRRGLGCALILGGPHVTLDPLRSLTTTAADFVVRGEGDLIIDDLLSHIEGRRSRVPAEGVGYYRGGTPVIGPAALVEDLSLLPPPRNELVDLERYVSIGVESSRGCDRACEFCFLSGYTPRCRFRPRPIEAVVAELQAIGRRVSLEQKKIYFLDLNFSRDRQRMIDLCDALIAAGLTQDKWVCCDLNLDTEAVTRLRRAGFSHIYVGLESGADAFIARYGKTVSRERVLAFYRMAKANGLAPQGDLVLMAPGETGQTLEETVALCREIYRIPATDTADRTRASFNVHLFKPFPSTRATAQLAAAGVQLPDTLLGWGQLYERLARGDLSPLASVVHATRGHLSWVLVRFALLNTGGYVLPRLRQRLVQRLRAHLPAWVRPRPQTPARDPVADREPSCKRAMSTPADLVRRRWPAERAALLLCDLSLDLTHPGWRARRLRHAQGRARLACEPPRLVAFDLDGTLVTARNSWALVTRDYPGRSAAARWLHRAYRAGALDHDGLCRAVVRLWQPPPTQHRLEQLANDLALQPGAAELVRCLRERGLELAIISSGLWPFAAAIAKRLAIPHVRANRPRYAADGTLLDVELGVSGPRKGEILRQLSDELGVPRALTLYVGDTADDLSAVLWAGTGVFLDNVNRHKAAADRIVPGVADLLPLLG